MRPTPLLLLAALLLSTSPARANDDYRGFYVSAKLGSTDIQADLDDSLQQVIDGDEDSLAFEAGYRFSRFWALQGGYHDFGNFAASGDCAVCSGVIDLRADAKAYSVAIVPQVDLIARLTVFGKVGIVVWETVVDATVDNVQSFIEDFTSEDILYGAGARFKAIGALHVFAEWERIASEIETISFGVTLQF